MSELQHNHTHSHAHTKEVSNRLAKAIGHLQKVKQMVEDGEDCSDVLVQLAAVRSALNSVGKVILRDHIRYCIVDAAAAGDREAIDNMCTALDKYL